MIEFDSMTFRAFINVRPSDSLPRHDNRITWIRCTNKIDAGRQVEFYSNIKLRASVFFKIIYHRMFDNSLGCNRYMYECAVPRKWPMSSAVGHVIVDNEGQIQMLRVLD